jgi:hypothetical protein
MKKPALDRRNFLKRSSAGVLGAGILGDQALKTQMKNPGDEPPRIRGYKTLGRTGFRVSDISLGVFFSDSIPRAALETGINLIETGEMYGRGNHERSLGKVIPDLKREDMFILTKISHTVKEYQTTDEVIARAEASIERLQSDYLDCYMMHGAVSSEMVLNEAFHKGVDRLNADGKVRFRGVSCHGHSWWDNPAETYEEILMTAIDDGRFDVILFPYNFFKKYGYESMEELKDAAIQYILGNPGMHSICFCFMDLGTIEKYIRLSGTTLDDGKQAMLDDFRRMYGPLQCRIGCNLCEPACPHGVQIQGLLALAHQSLAFNNIHYT